MLDLLAAALLAAAAAASSPDSARSSRVVREFGVVEVAGSRLSDAGAVQGVHTLSAQTIRRLPLDRFTDAIGLMPGVVVSGEDLHVRGGRAGELAVSLAGVPLNDPQFGGAPEVPLFALRVADLLTGPIDADRAGSLAGELDVQTEVPSATPRWRARWLSDGRRSLGDDAGHLGYTGPLARSGLGLALAGEVRLGEAGLPDLRALGRTRVLGRSFGWRADNHLIGWAKLAPVARPQSASLEVLASRTVRAPYDPMFTYDGWVTYHDVQPTDPPGTSFILLSQEPIGPNSIRYRAADHVAMTDERRLAVVAQASGGGWVRLHGAAGWLRTSTLTSVGLRPTGAGVSAANRPVFGPYDIVGVDPFHVYGGDEPYFRSAGADRLFARTDAALVPARRHRLRAGAGLAWESAQLEELDVAAPATPGVDSLRHYDASAPGGFAYVQHRWEAGGLILNEGLRVQAFDAGPQARDSRVQWSLSPRLGLAYPVSVRDAFSFGYARIHQDPARDFLYESRVRGYDRRPLGNGALVPSEVVQWQAAVKHILDPEWSFQMGIFLRDVYGEPGARNAPAAGGAPQLQYQSADDAHSGGFEVDVTRAGAGGQHLHAAFTFTNAWGSQSNPEGIAYGAAFGARPLPTGNHPLDWSEQYALALDGALEPVRDLWISWSTRVATGRPWTPLYREDESTSEWPPLYQDQSLINSKRLSWTETSRLDVRWTHRWLRGAALLMSVTNLFDHRGDVLGSISGYPNPVINTLYDEYAAYRTETGRDGGGYWNADGGGVRSWQAVHDPRLGQAPREVRLGVSIGD
jgi:hypothetical protein